MARPPSPSSSSSRGDDGDEATSSGDEQPPTTANPLSQTPTNHKQQQDADDEDDDDDEEEGEEEEESKHQSDEDEEDEDEEDEASDDDGDNSNKKPPPSSKPPSDSSDEDSDSESEPDSEAAELVTPISSRPMAEEPPARKRAKSAIASLNGALVNGGVRGLEEEFPMLKEAVAKLGNGFGMEEALKRIGAEKARVLERKMLKQKSMEMRQQLRKVELLEKSMKLVAEGIERAMESSDD